ncbi:peptidoglycan-binding domain-containing protein [Zongyangia hominis]|uniref:Peptidoglycan-binding protein n=1 Tax=Zongyangia hominis TaxID=2763677 RepID=A0A926EBK9_9FIRM|nr:peptidoglycan-binding domain-containing protein [Zongyangia hominis]MBC8570793.1 peptidoglycan-binding protein [Zongyangia hominis]
MATTINESIGQPIRSLQTMLRIISQYDSAVSAVIPDGIYANDTVTSVSSFQKRHGLPVTGEADHDTWYSIAEEHRRALVEVGPAEPVNPIFQKSQVIRPLEVNDHLYMIHGMLLAIGEHYPTLPRVSCNNVHDEASIAAARWLQVRAGIEPVGDINRSTWRYLARLYRITIGDGTRRV